MPIRCTITAAGVTNEYGQTLAVGTVYTPNNDNYALSLIQQGKATDTDASLVDPGFGAGNPQNTVFVNAAAIAAPTAQMLRDFGTEYALDVAPFGRYRTNGTAMVSIPTFNGTSLVSGDGSFLYGPVTSGTWMKVPSIFRLRITGTGTLQMDSKDSLGNITLATFPLTSYTSETDKIEFPYAGDDAVTIRVTLTGTLTCEVI